jgi:hypothetical protein
MIWSDRIGDCQLSVERVVGGYRARVVYCDALVYSGVHDTLSVAACLRSDRAVVAVSCHGSRR